MIIWIVIEEIFMKSIMVNVYKGLILCLLMDQGC